MADDFDPYHKWLGIPPAEQPAHHYRLLGITAMEVDPDVIERAADQRMGYVRTLSASKHSALAERILNELASARLTLLDAQRKAAYDQKLKAHLAKAQAVSAPRPAPVQKSLPKATPLPTPVPKAAPAIAPAAPNIQLASARLPAKPTPVWQQPLVLAGVAAAALVVILIAVIASQGGSDQGEVAAQNVPPTTPPAPAIVAPVVQPPSVAEQKVVPPAPQPMPMPPTPLPKPAEPTSQPPAPTASIEAPPVVEPAPEQPLEQPPEPAPVATPSPAPVVEPPPAVTPMPTVEVAVAAADPALPAPPTPAELKATELEIRELFRDELAAAKSPAQKHELAQKLLQQGIGTADDPISRFALLDAARRLATSAADYETTIAAIDSLAESFAVDATALKSDALQALSKVAKLPEQHKAIAEAASLLADEAIDRSQYDDAGQFHQLALAAARKAKDNDFAKFITARMKEIESLKKVAVAAKTAETALRANPADPEANLAYGKFLCLVQDDWPSGLAYLAKGSDAKLAALAKRDLTPPTTGDQLVLLADDWQVYSDVDKDFQTRAQHWYALSLPKLTGLTKTRIEKKLQELRSASVSSSSGLGSLAAEAVAILTFEKNTFQQRNNEAGFLDLSDRQQFAVKRGNARLVPGVAGVGLQCLGDTEGVELGGNFPSGAQPRTLCMWIRNEDRGSTDARYFWFGRTSEGGKAITFSIESKVDGKLGNYHSSLYNLDLTTALKPDSTWHFHCLIYDGKTLAYIIDGRPANAMPVVLDTGKSSITIGKKGRFTVDEIVLFERPLTEGEVQQIYQCGRTHRVLKKAPTAPAAAPAATSTKSDLGGAATPINTPLVAPIIAAPSVDKQPSFAPSSTSGEKDRVLYVDDLEFTAAQADYGTPGRHGMKNYSFGPPDERGTFQGEPLEHALSIHPFNGHKPAFVEVNVPAKAGSFRAICTSLGKTSTPLTFRVYGDGKELWKSAEVKAQDQAEPCDIPLVGVRQLRLEVVTENSRHGHAFWIEPRFVAAP